MAHNRKIENDMLFIRQGTMVEEMVGWQDYNDLATKTTPITLTLANTWYNLTNDGLGQYTNKKYRVLGKPDIWRPETNSFYFGDLYEGGIQLLRTSFYLTAPSANTEVSVRLLMAIGSGIEYSIPIFERYLKKGSVKYHFSVPTFFTIDNPETRDYPARIQVSADVTNCLVEVDGWKMLTLDRF